jgi:hypothetical protein
MRRRRSGSQQVRQDGGVIHREEGILRSGIVGETAEHTRRLIRTDASEDRVETGRSADHQGLDAGGLFRGRKGMNSS